MSKEHSHFWEYSDDDKARSCECGLTESTAHLDDAGIEPTIGPGNSYPMHGFSYGTAVCDKHKELRKKCKCPEPKVDPEWRDDNDYNTSEYYYRSHYAECPSKTADPVSDAGDGGDDE